MLGDIDAFGDGEHRNPGSLVIAEPENGNGIGMRHLPETERHQENQGAGVELTIDRAISDDR